MIDSSHILYLVRLLCWQVLLLALPLTSAMAAEPVNQLGIRIDPFADVPRMTQSWHYRWERHAYSTQGRPIETMQIGQGPFRTLIVGSLHGRESQAIEMTAQLATHLGTMPDHWHEFNVLIVRTPNPDGYANRSNRNARGIDLNRNFPSGDSFNAARITLANLSEGRETETQTLLDLIVDYRPHRIVHIKSTPNATGWALCNQRAGAMAAYLGKFRNLHVGKLESHVTTGSLEDCATSTLKIEAVTIGVPNRTATPVNWRDHRNALLAAAAHVDKDWRVPPSRPLSMQNRKSRALPVQRWPRSFLKRR